MLLGSTMHLSFFFLGFLFVFLSCCELPVGVGSSLPDQGRIPPLRGGHGVLTADCCAPRDTLLLSPEGRGLSGFDQDRMGENVHFYWKVM